MLLHCPDHCPAHTHIPIQRSFHGLPLLSSNPTVLNGQKQLPPCIPGLWTRLFLTYSQTPSMCLKLRMLDNPFQLHHLSAKQLFKAMLGPPWANGSEAEHAQATLFTSSSGSLDSVPELEVLCKTPQLHFARLLLKNHLHCSQRTMLN